MKNIEIDLEVEEKFYCPVTGQLIIDTEEYLKSPAMLFLYVEIAGEFECVQDWVRKIYDECEENDTDFDYFDRFLEKISKMSNVEIYEITMDGMACGPVSDIIYIGFDMSYRPTE